MQDGYNIADKPCSDAGTFELNRGKFTKIQIDRKRKTSKIKSYFILLVLFRRSHVYQTTFRKSDH